MIVPPKRSIAVIGVGIMGSAIARDLIAAGFAVRGFDTDPERIVEIVASSAGTSRIFELRGPIMASGVYTPPTATMHVLQKDSATIVEFARALGVDTPLLNAAAPLYDEAASLGYGGEDVAAVHAVLARRAGTGTTT